MSFWADLAAFTVAARGTEVVTRGLWRTALPLAAGMAAVQVMHGRMSPRDLAIDTGAFLATGFVIGGIADGMMYPLLFSATPPGRVARGIYTVAKLALVLYAGEKLGDAIRRRWVGKESAQQGVVQKLEVLDRH